MAGRIIVYPDTDDIDCRTWTWDCKLCGESTQGHRTSRVASAESEDHACQKDPLVVGQESLFGTA